MFNIIGKETFCNLLIRSAYFYAVKSDSKDDKPIILQPQRRQKQLTSMSSKQWFHHSQWWKYSEHPRQSWPVWHRLSGNHVASLWWNGPETQNKVLMTSHWHNQCRKCFEHPRQSWPVWYLLSGSHVASLWWKGPETQNRNLMTNIDITSVENILSILGKADQFDTARVVRPCKKKFLVLR